MCLDGLQTQCATIAAVQKEAGKSRAAALVLHGEPGVEEHAPSSGRLMGLDLSAP